VIALDTNLLVYAHRADAPFHAAALTVIKDIAEGSRPWAIPWPCLHEFLAKVTHPRIFRAPTDLELAFRQVAEWLRSPSARTIGEGEEYMETFAHVLLESKVTGAKVHDARIAAICLTNGVDELLSADRDFSRFARLRVRNPLTG
jgi:toxin-antitoxin system PIN domain toxin